MESKAIPFLCLLAVATSQMFQKNVNVTSIISVFGTPSPINGAASTPCTTPNGMAGECVPFFNCVNGTISTDGDGVSDSRFNRDSTCKPHLETCCLVPATITTSTTPTVITTDGNVYTTPHSTLLTTVRPDGGCGYRNPKGIGETTTTVDGQTKFAEFPWMCAILRINPTNSSDPLRQQLQSYAGGGSLIHPSIVLTAAHRVAKFRNIKVRAGEWNTQNALEPYPYQEREVGPIEIHPNFTRGNLFNDIALLFLTQPMDLAPNVGVVCLPPPKSSLYGIQRVPGGTKCFATGWGKDKFKPDGNYQVILKKVEVPVVNRDTCQAQLRLTRLYRYFLLHDSFMCAGGELGKDTCKGDGGSPLSCPIGFGENRYMQSGIVAWGIGCGTDGTPGVYVDVAVFREWVDDKVAGRGYDTRVYTY